MGNELRILCPPNTKFSQARGCFPLTTPASGPAPCTPGEHLAHRLSFPQFKMEWRPCISVRKGTPFFDDSRGNEPLGGIKIGGSMESLVEMVQSENSLQNYVNFTLWNGFSWAFKTLRPISYRGSAPWTPSTTMESPMKIVQIDNSVRNYMWILLLILPSKMGVPGLFKILKPMSFQGRCPLDPLATMESPMKIVQIVNSVQNYMWILPPILTSEMGFLGLLKC